MATSYTICYKFVTDHIVLLFHKNHITKYASQSVALSCHSTGKVVTVVKLRCGALIQNRLGGTMSSHPSSLHFITILWVVMVTSVYLAVIAVYVIHVLKIAMISISVTGIGFCLSHVGHLFERHRVRHQAQGTTQTLMCLAMFGVGPDHCV